MATTEDAPAGPVLGEEGLNDDASKREARRQCIDELREDSANWPASSAARADADALIRRWEAL